MLTPKLMQLGTLLTNSHGEVCRALAHVCCNSLTTSNRPWTEWIAILIPAPGCDDATATEAEYIQRTKDLMGTGDRPLKLIGISTWIIKFGTSTLLGARHQLTTQSSVRLLQSPTRSTVRLPSEMQLIGPLLDQASGNG